MDVLDSILDPKAEAVFLVEDEALHADTLSERLADQGIFVATIYLQAGDTSEIALRLLGQAFRFPGYYGVNWNAADECIQDMSWEEATGYVCLLLPRMIVGPPPQVVVDELAATFRYAAKFWRERGRACALFLFPPLTAS